MDITGKVVYHVMLNNKKNVPGRIISSDANKAFVEVAFENDSVYSRKFELVASLSKEPPILSTDDEALLAHIQAIRTKYYCSNCNKYCTNLSKYDSILVCSTCQRYICRCTSCNKYIIKNNCETKIYLSWPYCPECYFEKFDSCDCCGEWMPKAYIHRNEYVSEYNKLCWTCIEKYLEQCDLCEDYFPSEELCEIGNRKLCSTCITTTVGECTQCGTHSDYLKDVLCPACWIRNRYLSIYGTPSFFAGVRKYVEGSAYWLRDIDSIPIMSMLNGSSQNHVDILILSQYMQHNFKLLDLVIVSTPYEIGNNLCEYGSTMTEFKTDSGGKIRRYLTSLIELNEYTDVPLQTNELFRLFHSPYHLRAMTYKDMDYGKGKNEYGDTSSFLVIGVIEKI